MSEMTELWIPSEDGKEPSLFYFAGADRPLLVGLHTWSWDRFNQVEAMLPLAKKNGWSLLLPEFRGANLPSNPRCREACGSKKAIRDISDATDYVLKTYGAAEDQLLLLGASGGGHMALLACAAAPEKWRAVASFVPITDLNVWHEENPDYAKSIEACCGEDKREWRERSPIEYAKELTRANLKIFSGKWDASVPWHHGADMVKKITEADPKARVFFELFDGIHEMRIPDAERFFLEQLDKKESRTVTG